MTRPRFLFVHGWAGTPAIWDGVCAELAARGVDAADMTCVDLNPAYEGLALDAAGAMRVVMLGALAWPEYPPSPAP